MFSLNSRPLHERFGAELIGLDLRRADKDLALRLADASAQLGLVLIRDVDLDDAELAALASHFGPLQDFSPTRSRRMEVVRLSNLDDEGNLLPADHVNRGHQDANELWHTDNTYVIPGATFSFLYARIVPDNGGETEYCDTRVAWENLTPARQEELRPLVADHSLAHSRNKVGVDLATLYDKPMPPVVRRLVRHHVPSGRDALLLASHIERIEGMNAEESQRLVDELTAGASMPDCVYRHEWRIGDMLIWDNRCTLHRATPYPQLSQPRDMRSCRIVDIEDDAIGYRDASTR